MKRNQNNLAPRRKKPRKDWDNTAEKMNKLGEDKLLIPDVFEDDINTEEQKEGSL